MDREKVNCILSNMFLGTITPTSIVQNGLYITQNGDKISQERHLSFLPWIQASENSVNCKIYLKNLIKYFRLSRNSERNGVINLRLHNLGDEKLVDWKTCEQILSNCDFIVNLGSRIGDESEFETENLALVDFANKQIGFGCGRTQEEYLMGTFPEACAASILTNPMTDTQTISMSGCLDSNLNPRTILAMDALMFSVLPGENRIEQLREHNLIRELNKAFGGFSSLDPDLTVDSGFWGCGAFGGDPEIKILFK